MVHRHVKLPSHLYLSPPPPPNAASSSFTSPTSALFSLSPLTSTSPSVLLRETSSSAVAVTHRIPGFKTSASFLHTLRANLHLATSFDPCSPSPASSATHLPLLPSVDPNSPDCTNDDLWPPRQHSLGLSPDHSSSPSSPLPLSPTLPSPPPLNPSLNTSNPPANLPSPKIDLATSDADKCAALRLVADMVIEQRRIAATSLIFHPLVLALHIVILPILAKLFYRGRSRDLAVVLIMAAVATMAVLLGIRSAVSGYLVRAEEVGTWDWLDAGRRTGNGGKGEQDEVFVASLGDELIGALVIRGVQDPESAAGAAGVGWAKNHTKKRKRSLSSAAISHHVGSRVKGSIRAWTVKQQYRREGVGRALLEEAVSRCRDRGWSGPTFAHDHASSARVLPAMFNRGFEERERRARRTLDAYLDDANHGGGSPVASPRRAKSRR